MQASLHACDVKYYLTVPLLAGVQNHSFCAADGIRVLAVQNDIWYSRSEETMTATGAPICVTHVRYV